MNSQIENILSAFNPTSKVWIYIADKAFSDADSSVVQAKLDQFAATWTSHGHAVYGKAILYANQLFIFVADESKSEVSGCSIDKTLAILREIASAYQVNLFDRSLMALSLQNKFTVMKLEDLQQQIAEQKLSEDVAVYDCTINHSAAFATWQKPYSQSPYAKMSPVPSIQFIL